VIHILGIPGSLRKESYNAALLRAAAGLVPDECTINVASIRELPLYDGDLETAVGPPAVVAAFKQRILAADGLILASPEYNHSIPGVFKNAVDWASRPPSAFGGKPVAVMGATPGRMGTILAQSAWLPVLRVLGMRLYVGKSLMISGAAEVFADDGRITDETILDKLREFVCGFAGFVASSRG